MRVGTCEYCGGPIPHETTHCLTQNDYRLFSEDRLPMTISIPPSPPRPRPTWWRRLLDRLRRDRVRS